MILYGTGDFLLKVYQTALAAGHSPKACFIEPLEPSPPLPIPRFETYDPGFLAGEAVFPAFLDNTFRRNLSRRIQHPLARPIIHPTARVHPSVCIGDGTFIGPFVSIQEGTRIASLVIIEEGTLIGPGVFIAEGTYIGPSCQIAAHTSIQAYTYIGTGAILQSASQSTPLYIGEGTIIGPGIRVSSSCPAFSWLTTEKSWPVR